MDAQEISKYAEWYERKEKQRRRQMGMDFDNIYTYHTPKNDQPARYQAIRAKAKELAELVNGACPESRERSLAFTKLEESIFWANASIARNE